MVENKISASAEWLEKDSTKKAINVSKFQSGLLTLCLIKTAFLEVVKLWKASFNHIQTYTNGGVGKSCSWTEFIQKIVHYILTQAYNEKEKLRKHKKNSENTLNSNKC